MKKRLWWVAAVIIPLLPIGTARAQEGSELAGLLTATAWCMFSHDKDTGLSSTTRYKFFTDGTYTTGASKEVGLSGEAGSFVSRRSRTAVGTWQVKGNALLITVNGVAQEPLPLAVKGSGGSMPAIVAGGVELSPCE